MMRFKRFMTALEAIPFNEQDLPEGPAITL
jgi:hypothetical protein